MICSGAQRTLQTSNHPDQKGEKPMTELITKITEMIELDKRQMQTASEETRKALEQHIKALETFRQAFTA